MRGRFDARTFRAEISSWSATEIRERLVELWGEVEMSLRPGSRLVALSETMAEIAMISIELSTRIIRQGIVE